MLTTKTRGKGAKLEQPGKSWNASLPSPPISVEPDLTIDAKLIFHINMTSTYIFSAIKVAFTF